MCSVFGYRLEDTNCARNLLSQECSVVLEDISGVSSARYQTFTPPSTSTTTTPSVPMTTMLDQVRVGMEIGSGMCSLLPNHLGTESETPS